MVSVARIRPEDWQALKTVRLAALQDAPYAFATKYETMAAKPDDHWREIAADRAVSPDNATFLAWNADGIAIGMAAGFRDPEEPTVVHLVGVWVHPEWRGQGVAAPLIEGVCDWAAALPVPALHAYVTAQNHRALGFYQKVGFAVQPPDAPRPGAHGSPEDILILRPLYPSKEAI